MYEGETLIGFFIGPYKSYVQKQFQALYIKKTVILIKLAPGKKTMYRYANLGDSVKNVASCFY